MLKNNNGVWLNGQTEISKEFENYYSQTFNKPHTSEGADCIHLKRVLKSEASDWLQRDFDDEEAFGALKLWGRDKALGPDDFTSAFFLDYWEVVKESMLKAIKKISSGRDAERNRPNSYMSHPQES